jgi:hypothetical protein
MDLPCYVCEDAACRDYSLVGSASLKECQDALADCLAKGWLQIIDEQTLVQINDQLRQEHYVGPIYGMPRVGDVDFSSVGAELWQALYRRCFPGAELPFAFTDVVFCKTSHFFRTRAAALKWIEETREWDVDMAIVGPTLIGPWRAQWWRRFPEGYRIDVEERRQWQGRSCGEGQGCVMPLARFEAGNPQRLQQVLNCHNVSFPEWLLLAAMEQSWPREAASLLCRLAADSAKKLFGSTASAKACRTGLVACLQHGWLRRMDQQAVEEVQALLHKEPALMPVANEPANQGEIDFTPAGALLYRMIAAEWLGADWEDGLDVWKETFREEHRYCEVEEGLRDILEEYAGCGEVVLSSRIVPIGPWCVYWWEQFPAGYRLEQQIGTS